MKPGRLRLCVLALGAAACGPGERRVSVEETILERQKLGLEALVRAAEQGPLLPFDRMLVVVDQALVQDLLSAATPYERTIGSKYRIRVDAASVLFEDDFALVRLDGRASVAGHAVDEDAAADVSVFGALEIVELDPATGLLRGRLKTLGVEARHVDVLGITAPARRLVESLGKEKLEAFSALASALEIPVRLERDVQLPAVGPHGGVTIAAAHVPLRVAITDVKAFRGKLWICIGASTELK